MKGQARHDDGRQHLGMHSVTSGLPLLPKRGRLAFRLFQPANGMCLTGRSQAQSQSTEAALKVV